MTDFDRDIDAAIAIEEAALLRKIGEEPGYFRQLRTVFHGRTGWVNMILMVAQTVLFVGGVYAGWHFFQAADALTAVHWGLPGAVMLIMSLMVKLALWPVLHANRVLLAVKRLELELASR